MVFIKVDLPHTSSLSTQKQKNKKYEDKMQSCYISASPSQLESPFSTYTKLVSLAPDYTKQSDLEQGPRADMPLTTNVIQQIFMWWALE